MRNVSKVINLQTLRQIDARPLIFKTQGQHANSITFTIKLYNLQNFWFENSILPRPLVKLKQKTRTPNGAKHLVPYQCSRQTNVVKHVSPLVSNTDNTARIELNS